MGFGPGRLDPQGRVCRAGPGRRVGDVDVNVAVVVERRRMPEAAAAVDVRVRRIPQIFRHGGELPLGLARVGVERPQDALTVALVERLGVARDGRDVHGAVEDARRHVDALVRVPRQLLRTPDLLPCVLVEREGKVGCRTEDLPVAECNPVRADVGHVVVLRPLHLAGVEVDGLDVRGQVLRVDDTVRDDRRRRVVAERPATLDRHGPGDTQLLDVARVDLARRGNAVVPKILIGCRPLIGEVRQLTGRAGGHSRLVSAATARRECERDEAEQDDAATRTHASLPVTLEAVQKSWVTHLPLRA